MYIQVTLSNYAVRRKFIETGVMLPDDDHDVLFSFDSQSLSKEDRELIVSECRFDGIDTFVYEGYLINDYDFDINELLSIIRE